MTAQVRLEGASRENRELKARIVWIGLAATALLGALGARLWWLQIQNGEAYAAKSEGNFVKEVRVPADRGMILDRKGLILVDNRPSYDVFVTPAFCAPCDEVLTKLSARVSLDAEELSRLQAALQKARGLERFRPVAAKIDLTRDELDVLEATRDDLPGVDVLAVPHRNYRQGSLAAHLVGYLGEVSPEEMEKGGDEGRAYRQGEFIGKRGVERKMEAALHGVDGVQRVVADSRGRKLPHLERMIPEDERLEPAVPGNNVVLSIDARLQRAAELAFDGVAGAAVVMDVQTGFLLAVTSKPGFDPNLMTGRISRAQLKAFADDPLEPMLFRATQDHQHPGSTFKIVSQLAALEAGVHGGVTCGGGYTLGKRRWRCHNEGGHGFVEPEAAMQKSCDVWFYAAADRIGIDPIADMARRLGLGRPTGLDLGYEVPGVVPSVAYHDKVTPGGYMKGLALNTAIGQGDVNATPLQMVVAYAAIANGGTVWRPQVVRRVELPGGEPLQSFPPEVAGRLGVSEAHLARVQKGLDMVVNEPGGTAYGKRLPYLRVAGKTGTAQVVRLGTKRLKVGEMDYFERDHAWFAAYAPFEAPEIAVVVLNEHAGHGGAMAAPIAMRILETWWRLREEDARAAGPTDPTPTPPPARPTGSSAPSPLEGAPATGGRAAG